MPCYHPITAYRPRDGGKLLFQDGRGDADQIQIPCGQCRGCRRKRAQGWAIRCVHEARTHKHNCYITLTYNDEHVPVGLKHEHFQKFMSRLIASLHREIKQREKRAAPPVGGQRLVSQRQETATSLPSRPLAGSGGTGGRQNPRAFLWDPCEVSTSQSARRKKRASRRLHVGYYMCGEYGERTGRPHFHALLFGIDFSDKRLLKITKGHRLYESETLTKLWGMGHASVGDASFESARYISEYILKKWTGDKKNTYQVTDPVTGEVVEIQKEYNAMSKRPGVGSGYLRKYGDYLAHGWVIHQNVKLPPPRYYDKWFATHDPKQWEEVQHQRYLLQLQQIQHHTPERLAVAEAVDRAKTRTYKRDL